MSNIHDALTVSDIKEMQAIAIMAQEAGCPKVQVSTRDAIELCRVAIERLETLSEGGK